MGPGMFRPKLAFLQNVQVRCEFESSVNKAFSDANPNWDYHMKLEYCKVM
jgi:hypothetical protein